MSPRLLAVEVVSPACRCVFVVAHAPCKSTAASMDDVRQWRTVFASKMKQWRTEQRPVIP
eukprot:14726134-Alexandrium_andersonii.AAC.1